MRVFVGLLLLLGLSFSQAPAEYKLLKQFREGGDVKVGLFLLENYPEAVFRDELRIEVADLLLKEGDEERARFVLIGVNLDNVRDRYSKTVARLWKTLGLESKPLVLRFPEEAVELIQSVSLEEDEKERVYRRLLRKKLYRELLEVSDGCLYRGIALFRLKEYERSGDELFSCEGDRAGVYALFSYIKLGKYDRVEELLSSRDSERLYYKYAWHLLSKGDYEGARKFFLKSGYSFEPLFYVGLMDYIKGRYMLAYENFSEAERIAAGNINRARTNFWKAKALIRAGVKDLPVHYIKKAAGQMGLYSVVSLKMLGKPVYEEVRFKLAEEPSPFGRRLMGILELGFVHYARLEAFDKLGELQPQDIFALLKVDPYLAIKLAVRAYGANSDVYRSVAYPTPFSAFVERASERFRVDRALIYAVMRQESLFDVEALSTSDAKGLMQLIDSTAKWTGKRVGIDHRDVYDVETNINLGTAYLRFLMDFWKGDLLRVIASYNAGQGAVKRWKRFEDDFLFIETIPYDETRKYVRRVLWFYYVYSEKLSYKAF
ncbi:lytic transglycosylase domain-containing protein [Hydrogenivirga sp. 128-5-R1-1]|uniref:lytic transglycosylase domain-containing protein n=1 Tax=Hydrogenivirga sp. 128-5-R1-1 TaxID=392423 RepID=UPI00015F35C4|nr:lytic transglycosylase domain-containing protein [Hydrogenivirga sp. 128-5-R1-1]EDP76335.1 hypothetical protein HG1285_01973 [Hydrogenivirga sp. 128-5-R1-1]